MIKEIVYDHLSAVKKQANINVSNLSSGIYYCQIKAGLRNEVKKLIISD